MGGVAPEKTGNGAGAGGTVDDADDSPCWKSARGSFYCDFPLTMNRDRIPLLLLLPLTSGYSLGNSTFIIFKVDFLLRELGVEHQPNSTRCNKRNV